MFFWTITTLTMRTNSKYFYYKYEKVKRDRAVWSARQAHALKVVGSNPAPAS